MRITGGALKGRTILSPDGTRTRPTSDKTRQAIFNILAHEIVDAEILDMFAGSGALGIEALSRGARAATFVEKHTPTARLIQENLDRLHLTGRAINADWKTAASLLSAHSHYNLIFADPPYGEFPGHELLTTLIPLLAPEGILIIETDAKEEPVSDSTVARLLKTRAFGHARISFYCRGDIIAT